jgi:integrase
MFSAYLASITDRAQTTQRAARRTVSEFDKWRQGRTIDLALLDAYRAKLHRSRKAASSCNTEQSHLATALRFLIRRKLVDLDGDPAEILKPMPVKRKVPTVLDREQIRALWAVDMPAHETVKALMILGCRHQEAQALTPASVRQDTLVIDGFKTHRERAFPLALTGWTRYLFDKLPLPVLTHRLWADIRKAAGLGCPLKALRSTAASYISSSGKLPPMVAAALLGHSVGVLQENYFVPVFGVEGDDVPTWLGLANNPVEPSTLDNESNLVVG